MDLGKRLLQLRKSNDVTQEELGRQIGVGKTTISNYETGYSTPDTETISRIADFFNVSVDYLLGRTDEPNDVHQRIESALVDEPDADELIAFWREMKEREDLKLLFKQVRPLSDDSIRRVIRVIQAIELEESQE